MRAPRVTGTHRYDIQVLATHMLTRVWQELEMSHQCLAECKVWVPAAAWTSRRREYNGATLLGRAHIETQADAEQGRAGQGDAARRTLLDRV